MRLVRLRSGELEAAFAPVAGMVGCSLTHRGDELLAQRKGLEEYARSGSTFGIPFLHPWANRLSGFGYAARGQEVTPAGHELICFEPMTAPGNALVSHDGLRLAPPGEPFTAAFRIFVDG